MAAFRLLGAVAFALALCAGAADPAQLRERQAAVQPAPPTAPGQAPAEKSPEMRIAAVVNDEVISVFDVVSRMRMVMISSNIADSPEMRQRIAPQVLHSLIDEKLELQEAKRQSVTATDSEVNTGLQQIEKQNNMKSGQLNELLKSRGIDRGGRRRHRLAAGRPAAARAGQGGVGPAAGRTVGGGSGHRRVLPAARRRPSQRQHERERAGHGLRYRAGGVCAARPGQ